MAHTASHDEFARWVHEALNRLYDAPYLQTHPLAAALAGPDVSPLRHSQNLRRIMLNAIHALRPESGSTAQATDRRAARILTLRFVEGLSPAEAMQQLAYGRSQFFAEQARMLDLLINTCWSHYRELHPARLDAPNAAVPEPAALTGEASANREQLAHAEVERLLAHATWEIVDLAQLVDSLQPLISRLAQATAATVAFDLGASPAISQGDRVLLRQAVLNTIAYACDLAPQSQVEVRTFVEPGAIGIVVRVHGHIQAAEPDRNSQRPAIGLDVCRQVMRAMQGHYATTTNNIDIWQARLSWRSLPPQTLLVIDDNEGFVGLLRRYLAGHCWRVVGATTGSAGRAAIAELQPAVVIVDVMMPKEDGWEFLIALRAAPATYDLPVIVSSVLNEPQIATALGANGYLLKPVTQEALFQALAPWWTTDANPAQAH